MNLESKYLLSNSEEFFQINSSNAKITKNQYLQLTRKIRVLEMLAPSRSKIILEFEKKDLNSLQATLTIKGHGKKFVSKMTGICPIQLYQCLERNIKTQLSSWKKTRFLKKNKHIYDDHIYENLTGGYAA